MNDAPRTFETVDDQFLAERIAQATRRVIFVAPALGLKAAQALASAMMHEHIQVDIVLDANPDSVRIGYGDVEGLERLRAALLEARRPLRHEPGVRIGLLIADDVVVIWSPTPLSVEPARTGGEANGLVLSGAVVESCAAATGRPADPGESSIPEIGRATIIPETLHETLEELKHNPPAPFDLSRRTRVFATRFQFVESEIRGAEWTERRIRLSSLLMNADLPESLRDLMETQIRPFQERGDLAFPVPHLVHGRRAFDESGRRMIVPATQADIMKAWTDTRDRYLHSLKGFGWIIRRDRLADFRTDIAAFEETLNEWVAAFRASVFEREDALVAKIVTAIRARVERSVQRKALERLDLEHDVRKGLQRLRVIEPKVRIVLKDVAWESTRDKEFEGALAEALDPDDLSGWFEEFTAAPQRHSSNSET